MIFIGILFWTWSLHEKRKYSLIYYFTNVCKSDMKLLSRSQSSSIYGKMSLNYFVFNLRVVSCRSIQNRFEIRGFKWCCSLWWAILIGMTVSFLCLNFLILPKVDSIRGQKKDEKFVCLFFLFFFWMFRFYFNKGRSWLSDPYEISLCIYFYGYNNSRIYWYV